MNTVTLVLIGMLVAWALTLWAVRRYLDWCDG